MQPNPTADTSRLLFPSFVIYFTSAVGLYPGDEVRIVGVPVGTVDSIEPRATDVKVTMSVKDGVKVPADAKALVIAPNLVSARFVQLMPAYTDGAAMADGAEIGLDRTAVPVEWDEVKEQLTQLSTQLGPQQGSMQGPLAAFVNQAADTFDGNGDSFRSVTINGLRGSASAIGSTRSPGMGLGARVRTRGLQGLRFIWILAIVPRSRLPRMSYVAIAADQESVT